MNKILFILSFLAISTISFGQGFLRGKIIDGETGEGLIGATAVKEGTTNGAVADFDGNYSLTLDPGVHTVVFQFVSYQTQTITDITIKDGETTTLDITLSPASTEMEQVVITAALARDTEGALLTVQQRSPNFLDGISAQTFRKLGDSDLSVAMKRVTGVSVQGGKYVYVRGLGDRYTLTNLNGMSIPGLDPDNNSVQMDIFPTSTIENVIVYKTFSPNLPGDFTGGLVDVESKSFPDEKTTALSIGTGYNPNMNLKSNYLSYDGGGTDFLGFDDGTRKLPFSKNAKIPDVSASNGAEAEKYTRSFNPQLAAQEKPSFLNYNFSFNHGNQLEKGNKTFGYNAVLTYRTNYEYYDNVEFGEYLKDANPDNNQLEGAEIRTGRLGQTNTAWSALLAGALKFDNHSFALSILRNQDATSSASERTSTNLLSNPSVLYDNILTYTQRSVTNAILVGKHHFNQFDLEWRGAYSASRIYEPDFRVTRIHVIDEGVYDMQVGVGAGIDRFYRDLNENNTSFKVDGTYNFGEKNKLKVGGSGTFKNRDFEVLEYYFRVRGAEEITSNPDNFLKSENIWTPETDQGTVVKGNYDPSKNFNATQQVYAGYAMTEMQVLPALKAIYGVRAEQVMMYYTGSNQNFQKFNNENTLDNLDLLPSVNLVYSLTDAMNLRVSANRTLARPSFREKSNAQIYDPISKRTFIGNLDLEEAHINNYDLRWEYFFSNNQMVSFSTFYKSFNGHIEMVSFETAPDNIKPRNSGKSDLVGVEVEFRKSLNGQFSIGSNASFVKSMVDLNTIQVNEFGKTELELRQENARTDETIDKTRPMAGQSPYLINAFVGFQSIDHSWNANLAYNVQGQTLSIVGSGLVPDIYTKPFNSLNLSVSHDFGAAFNSRLTFGVTNILGAEKTDFYKSFGAEDRTFSIYRPGRTFTLKYAYTF